MPVGRLMCVHIFPGGACRVDATLRPLVWYPGPFSTALGGVACCLMYGNLHQTHLPINHGCCATRGGTGARSLPFAALSF